MSKDWKPGDLAVAQECACGWSGHRETGAIKTGHTYRVVGLRSGPFKNCVAPYGLHLADVRDAKGTGFCSLRFRKVKPDTQEPCEAEFTELLNRSKKRVGA